MKKIKKETRVETGKLVCLKMIMVVSLVLMTGLAAQGREVTREQIKGLDEQIQEIKTDILAIAAELEQLEEKLLYPSDTQVSLFVSLGGSEEFRLDSVEIDINGTTVATHIYTYQELQALEKGGVQRIHTGNLRVGEHELEVSYTGLSAEGAEFSRTNSFTIDKGVGPEIVEISLTPFRATLQGQ